MDRGMRHRERVWVMQPLIVGAGNNHPIVHLPGPTPRHPLQHRLPCFAGIAAVGGHQLEIASLVAEALGLPWERHPWTGITESTTRPVRPAGSRSWEETSSAGAVAPPTVSEAFLQFGFLDR